MSNEPNQPYAGDPDPDSFSQTSLANVGKYLGYAPGTWYDKGDFSPDAQRRFGNLVTGTGLGAAGALSVPLLQWLFPERFAKFPGQGKRLALAALLGGIALPFAATLPAEIRAFNNWRNDVPNAAGGGPSSEAPTAPTTAQASPTTPRRVTAEDFIWQDAGHGGVMGNVEDEVKYLLSRNTELNQQIQNNPELFRDHVGFGKKSNFGQFSPQFPMAKSHLASSVIDEVRAGTLSPHSATSFMQSIGQQTPGNQPWFTVGDVTRAALGAGAGAFTGSLVGKGLSFFLGLTPKGRKNIRNIGMGLGALINTGKLGV
jgi:hypothetical protein